MKASLWAITLGLGLLTTIPVQAQRVRAEVIVGTGPVSGRVVIGEPHHRYRDGYVHRYPARRVIVERHSPRIIVVERIHRGRGHYQHHRHRDFRHVRAYYDSDRQAYYDSYRPGLRQVIVYQRDGRYYHRDDDHFRDRDRDDYYDD